MLGKKIDDTLTSGTFDMVYHDGGTVLKTSRVINTANSSQESL